MSNISDNYNSDGNDVYSNDSFSESDLPEEVEIGEKLWLYLSPVVIILGTITNILAIRILLRKSMRSSTTMFYLCVLAFADISVLYAGLLRQWIKHTFNIDYRDTSEFGCKFGLFIVYFTMDFAVWTLVAGTIDRCVSVCQPLKSKSFQGLRNARISICVCAFLLFALNCHFLWTGALITEDDGPPYCLALDHNMEFSYTIWPWIDFCFVCVIPFTIMIVCNILIIRKIIVSRKQMQPHTSSRKRPTASSNSPATPDRSRNTYNSGKVQSVTVMLLAVNILFLFLTSPVVIYIIGIKYWHVDGNSYGDELLILFWPIVNLLMYTNSAINFFLYCLTGPRFRREMYAVFRCSRKFRSQTLTSSTMSRTTSSSIRSVTQNVSL